MTVIELSMIYAPTPASISRSKMSFTVHPAPRIRNAATTENAKCRRYSVGGVATLNAARVRPHANVQDISATIGARGKGRLEVYQKAKKSIQFLLAAVRLSVSRTQEPYRYSPYESESVLDRAGAYLLKGKRSRSGDMYCRTVSTHIIRGYGCQCDYGPTMNNGVRTPTHSLDIVVMVTHDWEATALRYGV